MKVPPASLLTPLCYPFCGVGPPPLRRHLILTHLPPHSMQFQLHMLLKTCLTRCEQFWIGNICRWLSSSGS